MNSTKIRFLLLLVITGNSMQAKGFATSIFWQVPPNAPTAQFMFSNENPGDITYNIPEFSSAKAYNERYGNYTNLVSNALKAKAFNQYLVGPYFTAGSSTQVFYITGKTKEPPAVTKPTKEPPAVTKPIKEPAINTEVLAVRLASLGILELIVTEVSTDRDKSFTRLMMLSNIILKSPYLIFPKEKRQGGGFDISHTWVPAPQFATKWNKYSKGFPSDKYNSKSGYIVQEVGKVISAVFQSSLITQKTTLTLQSFTPVGSVLATTYFDDDNIVVAYHAITPGKGTVKVSNSTTLADIMANQNTYTNLYPKTGTPACGDTFGF